MPGIAGIISNRPATDCECLVRSMVTSMQHEDFYTSGCYSVPELGVYAGWTAHNCSFSASQPFLNETRDIVLLFSGECFIDPEGHRPPTRNGHRVARNTADWLSHLYEEEGIGFLKELNGLFSGLLIDQRESKAFLFNDRYGVERIYFHECNGVFYFASEAKALLRILPDLREFDAEGVAQFLAFGCTLGTGTLFRGINTLPGGSLWSFEGGSCYKRKYFSPDEWEAQPILSVERFQSEFEDTFKRILPRYFESESKIGISLTAGLDSRMIMACVPKTKEQPICYTFSGDNCDTFDARLARRVAKACGLDHETIRLGRDFFSNFAAHVDRTVYVTDGCLGTLGAHEIYLNGQARSLAPVRLTGVFGGEILRGVSMFKPLPLSRYLVNPVLEKSLSSFGWEKPRKNQQRVTFAAFREVPEKRFGVPAAGRSQVTFRTPYLDNEIVALAYRVPTELSSSALPAWQMIEANNVTLSKTPTDMGKTGESRRLVAAFRRLFCRSLFKLDYLYSEGLPHWLSPLDPWFAAIGAGVGIVGRHKFLQYRSWFRRELAAYVNESIKDIQSRCSWPWNRRFLDSLAHEHICGHKNYVREINAVITLGTVERLLFRDLPREVEQPATAFTESLRQESSVVTATHRSSK